MSQLLITHGFVKKLATNIRDRYGKEVRHTQVIELISDALGRKAGPMMHTLKHSLVHDTQLSSRPNSAHLSSVSREEALISVAEPSEDDLPMLKTEWMRENGIDRNLNPDIAEELFTEQLGRRWRDFWGATRPGKVALIILALASLKFTDSDGRSGISAATERFMSTKGGVGAIRGPMWDLIQEFGRDPKVMRIIEKVGSKHAYENTVIHGMMHHLHEMGFEVDPMEMLFIRNLDVSMWYGILNFKRDRFYVQGAGIVSHFLTERILKRPEVEPRVYHATEDLDLYRDPPEPHTAH